MPIATPPSRRNPGAKTCSRRNVPSAATVVDVGIGPIISMSLRTIDTCRPALGGSGSPVVVTTRPEKVAPGVIVSTRPSTSVPSTSTVADANSVALDGPVMPFDAVRR